MSESFQRAQALMQDKQHSALCQSVYDDFRKNAKTGMTSEQFARAVNTEWVEKANILASSRGFSTGPPHPLDMDRFSMGYDVVLYPNEDSYSNYVLYFRISKPNAVNLEKCTSEEYTKIGEQFLQGDLRQSSVVLKEVICCLFSGKDAVRKPVIFRIGERTENKPNK
ncbi:hypothetical protein ACFLS1_12775 [Verrucomicrobiota bacterium]